MKYFSLKQGLCSFLIITSGLIAPSAFAQDSVVSLEEAIKASKVLANFRLRYEGADFDNGTETADALTYRARVGFETGAFLDTKFLVEFDHIEDITGDFNDTINGNTGFAVIADPSATELNRLQLTNTSLPDTKLTAGRQRIILDDSRFVGNVGWRQNEQTYDAVRVTNTSIKGLTLDASYVDQVNRIFGDEAPSGRFDSESWLLNAGYKLPVEGANVKISGFAYLLDLSNAGLSSNTYGAQLWAKKGPLAVVGRYATQSDAGDNPVDYSADHYFAEASFKKNGFNAALGYEVLGADSDSDGSFTTPLATLHKFNGFADVFLATPTQGLEDLYIKGGYKTGPIGPLPFINMFAVYHDFDSNKGGIDFGSEIDAVIATKLTKKVGLLFKFADYSQGDVGTPFSRTRYSVQLDYGF
ncbi:MAG: major outer membrane protein [Maricaulaceae bacterium]